MMNECVKCGLIGAVLILGVPLFSLGCVLIAFDIRDTFRRIRKNYRAQTGPDARPNVEPKN